MKFRLAMTSAAAVAMIVGVAQAETANMTVSATVVDECTALNVAPLSFGTNIGGLITEAVDSQANITVECNSDATYELALDAGANAGTDGTTGRKMALVGGAGTEPKLPYSLSSVSAGGTNWGNTADDDVDGIGTGASVTHTVYGRIPATAGNIPTGSYQDTVVVTLTY